MSNVFVVKNLFLNSKAGVRLKVTRCLRTSLNNTY